ncbi:MAG: hypothetical protein KKC79_00145 [Gammaproteobacteria bacterium]|nr:hypothetical protein [Gammaproteobacteria bacterium]MBU1530559.1 hypothetical protein [Gammaproteobacteria bacterium]MBU2285294.1 hypothetical protein [Gammaproteobacteria bacterium]MBU2407040.1 hypothetical protein [Gammaproteobacteria bacterium]
MSQPRHVIMQVVMRSGGATHHVEFVIDANFAERLRQLRSLVPPLNTLNSQRDLVIDKVRVRLPTAVWRCNGQADAQFESQVDGSCMVIASEGFFNCGGKDRKTKEKLVTYTFPISRLLELHAERPEGETFYIRDGIFANDEPANSSAGRWVASLHELEEMRTPDAPPSDFDTIQGVPLRSVHGALPTHGLSLS